MIVADSSVTVAALAPWHEEHPAAAAALARTDRLIAHVALETYSVLTRLPEGLRMPPEVAAALLAEHFPGAPLALPAKATMALIADCAARRITGGAVHDALIAATARHAGATLLTRDRRALATYTAVGATVDVVPPG